MSNQNDSNEKQRTTRQAGGAGGGRGEQRLRTYRRVMKTPEDIEGPRPGAYDVAGRAHGEIPSWIQQPRAVVAAPQQAHVVKHVVADAEVISDSDAIVAASVVIERRIGFQRLRNLGGRRSKNHGQTQTATRLPQAGNSSRNRPNVAVALGEEEGATTAPCTLSEELHTLRYDEEPDVGGNTHGKRRSKHDLLEDNQDDEILQDRFLQGLQSARVPRDEEMTASHPHVQSVLEVFPEADIQRIMSLLRQESLATTLIVLAEESLGKPSDDVMPTELNHCTTYAQATDQDRDLIMSYLKDMFPHIGTKQIAEVLMQHSTHQGVAILSNGLPTENTTASRKPPPVAAAAAAAAAAPVAKRQSLIDSDEEEELELLDLHKIPWSPPKGVQHRPSPRLELKKSASFSDRKKAAVGKPAMQKPVLEHQRSASYDNVLALVLTQSRQDALDQQRKSWESGLVDNHQQEDDVKQSASERVNPKDFYDLNALKRTN